MSPTPSPIPPAADAPCPCGSGRSFGQCCGPIIQEQRVAATAEELMRSRFTAHCIRDFRHLHRTYLPTAHRPYVEEGDAPATNWTRLVIHAHEPGLKPETAFVDFSAYYKNGDAEDVLQEKAEFVRQDGRWFYTRAARLGPPPVRSTHPKVGRNDPCPCGSGRKYKHCCGR